MATSPSSKGSVQGKAGEGFRTTDLSLATLLSLHGYQYKHERDGDGCVWLFSGECSHGNADASVTETAAQYEDGRAAVEPRRFVRELSFVRNDMYKFLEED